jgi:hypothetical protein
MAVPPVPARRVAAAREGLPGGAAAAAAWAAKAAEAEGWGRARAAVLCASPRRA